MSLHSNVTRIQSQLKVEQIRKIVLTMRRFDISPEQIVEFIKENEKEKEQNNALLMYRAAKTNTPIVEKSKPAVVSSKGWSLSNGK